MGGEPKDEILDGLAEGNTKVETIDGGARVEPEDDPEQCQDEGPWQNWQN